MNCKFHPQKTTDERCFHCKNFICPACIRSYEKHFFCPTCYEQALHETDEYHADPSPIQDAIQAHEQKPGSSMSDFFKFAIFFGIGFIVVGIVFYFIMYLSAVTSRID